MIIFKSKGNWERTTKYLKSLSKEEFLDRLNFYGEMGIQILSKLTPKDTGLTASSWSYEIKKTINGTNIEWHNSNVNKGLPIAILIQYGHGTGTGAYVEGVDYINPAIKSVYEFAVDEIWGKVVR